MHEHYEKWKKFSPVGLLLTGLGLSVVGAATLKKREGGGWVWRGTLGLVIFNAGLAIFGEAIKSRAVYEAELERMRRD